MGCDVSTWDYEMKKAQERIADALERIVEMMEEDRKPMISPTPAVSPNHYRFDHLYRVASTAHSSDTHEGPYGYGSQDR